MMFRSTLLTVSIVLISACDKGGSNGNEAPVIENGEVTEITSPDQLIKIEMLRTYSGPEDSFGYLNLTMPADGPVFFQRIGTNLRIYDDGLRLIAERTGTMPDAIDLNAGKYAVEFEFWSRRVKIITAYSPRLLNFESLVPLANGTYTSTDNKTEFMRFTPTMDTTLNATGFGVRVAVYTPEMEKVVGSLEQKSAVNLLAGNYVVELNYFSIREKEITIQSPAL